MTAAANIAALTKSAQDIRSPMGQCALMSANVQLLPLRYGLVENLDPSAELSIPLKLNSQPLGIRLLRDGYLYIIDSSSGFLHEYRVEQGQISKLVWKGREVASDTRTASVGEPQLVFPRQHTLFASYSEIQWTAFKCSQVLTHATEREHWMQRIELASACPDQGGMNLLSQRQANTWLAEVAETFAPIDLPEGANPQQRQSYAWEDASLFQNTSIETLTSQVLGAYQNDYLFLVLRDDFGVMRDLASAQLNVAHWLDQWSNDDVAQRKYLTGAYIQSLYEVTAARLDVLATTEPDVKALKDETSAEQQAAVQDYLRAKRNHSGPPIFGDEAHWREAALSDPYARAAVNLQDALGDMLWQKHRNTVNALHLQTWEALFGKEIGQRGIDHLVNRNAMQAFVAQQQTLLSHWHKRLQAIREDRLHMIVAGHFHRAAWYYDFRNDQQIRHRLETEFLCVAALCGNREATEKLATYLDSNLLTVVPGLDTLSLADQIDVSKKLMDLSNFSIKVAAAPESLDAVNMLSNQFRRLMNERLPNFADLNARFSGLQSLLDGAYMPAHQLIAADQLDRAYGEFKRQQPVDPNSFIRSLGVSTRLQLLREFSRSGLALRAASASEFQAFNQTRDAALELRRKLKDTYKLRHRELSRQIYGLATPGSELMHNQRINQLKAALVPLEDNLSRALTVGASGPGQIGTVIDGMAPALREEMQRTVRDFRATGTFGKPMTSALKSKGDGIALLLFVYQGQKFLEVLSAFNKKTDRPFSQTWTLIETFLGMSAAGFGAVQGLSVTILQAHIEQMDSAAGKLNTMSRLGRWSGIAGSAAFGFGALVAAIDVGEHSVQWTKALAEGNHQALAGKSLEIAGDSILVGTTTWGAIHTSSIISQVLKQPAELRAVAWAEASPRLLSIAARANLVGLIGTALQLLGEGFYNFFSLDALQKWLQASAWGRADLQRSLPEDWSALAMVVQQPSCELIREGQRTYLQLRLPGVRTREMDSRQLQLLAHQQTRAAPIPSPYNNQLPARRWQECSAAWAAVAVVVSQENEALTLRLPIAEALQTTDFTLALNIGYQLEAERDLIHRTCFVLRDLRIATERGVRLPAQGRFTLDPVETLPTGLSKAPCWLFTRDEMATVDV
ncbi:membrane protein [Pseudomonas fluorescens]|uniref:Membrane protein n=1 Tax=Pseudomonas fluorescens TaxID=294 RepID=A0A448DLB2_PSEFL|nr:toxin VasX [Pseudomonas fluorescens]VEF07617.1 membrane protein [Pseudomonas fluorescens]